MLTGIFPAYVDRFALGWHRLSTTDLCFGNRWYYTAKTSQNQAFLTHSFQKIQRKIWENIGEIPHCIFGENVVS